MGQYLRRARHHASKIQYYYAQAGSRGYSQAEYHYSELSELLLRASKSKNDKNDTLVIQALKESAVGLMEEMQKRRQDNTD
jgi:hypothetical protein